jgi:hypothetical protein
MFLKTQITKTVLLKIVLVICVLILFQKCKSVEIIVALLL